MRKISLALLVVVSTSAFGLSGCANLGAGPSSPGSGAGITVSDALTQAQGALTALETLAGTSPMSAETQAQVKGYAAWADFALKAAGIVVPVAQAVGS